MIARCENQGVQEYRDYGGRGVLVCDEWHDYNNFRSWALKNGYTDALTLDRIDVNGNYTPGNCRWATYKVQANNTRRNKMLTYNGETHTMAEWADLMGMPYQRLNTRIHLGWSVERALSEPARKTAVMK